MQPGAKPTLAVIVEQDTNRFLVTRQADGRKSAPQKLSADFKAMPSSMTMHDANQDGLADLIILIPYEKIKVLIQKPDKNSFEETDVLPPGGSTEEPWLSVSDVDGDGKPELLLAQKNFVRAVVLKPEADRATNGKPVWNFIVKEQINGASSDSQIVGAAPLRNGTNAIASIFLLDAERKALDPERTGQGRRLAGGAQPAAAGDRIHRLARGRSRLDQRQQRGVDRRQCCGHPRHQRTRSGSFRSWTVTRRPSKTDI